MPNLINPNDPAHDGKLVSLCQATGIKTDLLGYQQIFKSEKLFVKVLLNTPRNGKTP